jgi:2-hydroxychromene-2-carboxylate isomerase
VAEQNNYFHNYIDKFFVAAWVDSLNLNDEKIFEKFLKNMNINFADFYQKLSEPKIKDDLKNRTETAFKKGIFGAPTFVVNGKMFWGQDRLEFVFKEAKK